MTDTKKIELDFDDDDLKITPFLSFKNQNTHRIQIIEYLGKGTTQFETKDKPTPNWNFKVKDLDRVELGIIDWNPTAKTAVYALKNFMPFENKKFLVQKISQGNGFIYQVNKL